MRMKVSPVRLADRRQAQEMVERHPALDPVRVVALERLSQVESHSDDFDELTCVSACKSDPHLGDIGVQK